MEPWNSRPNKVKQVITTLADGLNQYNESIEIKDSQATTVINMDSLLYPTIQVADGHVLYSTHIGYINKIFKFKNVMYCGTDKGLYKQSGSTWVAVYEYTGINNTRLWDVAMFFDGSKLFFVDGALQLRQYDGTTLSTLSSAPAASKYMTTHANRFYLANMNDNLLSYSGLRDAADWTSTNKYTGTGKITVETADGEKPTGLTTFANHVILFKKWTMHELFGEDSTNFQMQNPYGVGCISDRSIVQTNEALYWLATDGVYMYMGGSAPIRISDPIQNYINQINMDYGQECVAGYDGRFLYLTLLLGTSTKPNITLKYDIQNRSWWPLSFVASSFFLDGQTFYFGTLDGQIMRQGGTTYNNTPITWSYETKPFSDNDETVRKAIHRIWIVADIEVSSTLKVEYANGTEGIVWNEIYSSTNGSGRIQSIKIPVIVRTPETWFRLRLSGTGKAKIHRVIREITRRGS
jgi:hypothetical protein